MARFYLIIPLILLVLSGCSGLFPKPADPPMLWVLNPWQPQPVEVAASANVQREEQKPLTWHLAIDLPSGGSSFDTSRVSILRSPQIMEYLARHEWADRVPMLLQGLLVKAFENSHRIIGVARASAGINPDRLLMVDIRQFSVIKEATSYVHVALTVKLLDMETRRIVQSSVFEHKQPLQTLEHKDILEAFQGAVNHVMDHIVDWTLATQ